MFLSRNKKNIDIFWWKKSALSRAMVGLGDCIMIQLHFLGIFTCIFLLYCGKENWPASACSSV